MTSQALAVLPDRAAVRRDRFPAQLHLLRPPEHAHARNRRRDLDRLLFRDRPVAQGRARWGFLGLVLADSAKQAAHAIIMGALLLRSVGPAAPAACPANVRPLGTCCHA